MTLPTGWVEAPAEPIFGGRERRRFHIQAAPEVFFLSEVRNEPLSNPAANAFQHTLYCEFHRLEISEIETLDDSLEALANSNAFTISEATTGYLNARRALFVSGLWKQENSQAIAAILDLKGDGRFIQLLYFSAPKERFGEVEKDFRSILRSIEWSD